MDKIRQVVRPAKGNNLTMAEEDVKFPQSSIKFKLFPFAFQVSFVFNKSEATFQHINRRTVGRTVPQVR